MEAFNRYLTPNSFKFTKMEDSEVSSDDDSDSGSVSYRSSDGGGGGGGGVCDASR